MELPADRQAALEEIEQAEQRLANTARCFNAGHPIRDWIERTLVQLESLTRLLGDPDA